MQDAIRAKHYSPRTEEASLGWLRRFISFHAMGTPPISDAQHTCESLNCLATEKTVASSTQNQALNAVDRNASEGVKELEHAAWGHAASIKSAGLSRGSWRPGAPWPAIASGRRRLATRFFHTF